MTRSIRDTLQTAWAANLPTRVMAPAVSLVWALALAVPALAAADTLTGEVVGLADGDTLTVLDGTRTQHKVRLAGIDAPERQQAFGDRSRQHLASLVLRRQVSVEWQKQDRYGRLVGKVVHEGQDVNLQQIRAGLAWHYKTYEREQPAAERQAYAEAELQARAAGLGLWQDPRPTPPWEYRAQASPTPAVP